MHSHWKVAAMAVSAREARREARRSTVAKPQIGVEWFVGFDDFSYGFDDQSNMSNTNHPPAGNFEKLFLCMLLCQIPTTNQLLKRMFWFFFMNLT